MSPRFDRRTPRRHHLAVVQRSLSWRKALCIGSSTGLGSIAQLGEHLPYKQRVTGSSPVVPTIICGCSSSGRAPPCQGGGSGFEPRHPLQVKSICNADAFLFCIFSVLSRGSKATVKKTVRWTVFRESVDESMTMNKPHWRGRKFDK